MKKKMILGVLGGVVAGIAAVPIIQGINYSLGDWISKRIRKEIDQYEDDKEFEAEMKEYEEYEKEQESLFDEDLDDEFDLDFVSSDDVLSEPFSKKLTVSDRDTISRETVEDAFIMLINNCWKNEGRHSELDELNRQDLAKKELEPIMDSLYSRVIWGMKNQNDAAIEIDLHQKSFGKSVLDEAACKIMNLEIGSIKDNDILSVIVSHELWLDNDGEFVLIDRVIEGNDDKAYEFYVFIGYVNECYNLNLSGETLIKKIKDFAEKGID